MKKPILISFSDLHINLWNKFNENNNRTLNHFEVLFRIKKISLKLKVPVVFCGDMFHKPEYIDTELLEIFLSNNKKLSSKDFKCYCISGNHDQSKPNSLKKQSPSLIRAFSYCCDWLELLDFRSLKVGNLGIHGIPYIDNNVGISGYIKNLKLYEGVPNILLLHTDYPGAKDTDGRKIDSVENLNINSLRKFNLVLCGHIHQPQRLSKNVYMVGAPLQQRRTDKFTKLGYHIIYSDLSVKFVELDGFPKFIDIEDEKDRKDDGNYYTVVPKTKEEEKLEVKTYNLNMSKIKLARRYIKDNKIKDKSKIRLLKKIIKETDYDD